MTKKTNSNSTFYLIAGIVLVALAVMGFVLFVFFKGIDDDASYESYEAERLVGDSQTYGHISDSTRQDNLALAEADALHESNEQEVQVFEREVDNDNPYLPLVTSEAGDENRLADYIDDLDALKRLSVELASNNAALVSDHEELQEGYHALLNELESVKQQIAQNRQQIEYTKKEVKDLVADKGSSTKRLQQNTAPVFKPSPRFANYPQCSSKLVLIDDWKVIRGRLVHVNTGTTLVITSNRIVPSYGAIIAYDDVLEQACTKRGLIAK